MGQDSLDKGYKAEVNAGISNTRMDVFGCLRLVDFVLEEDEEIVLGKDMEILSSRIQQASILVPI